MKVDPNKLNDARWAACNHRYPYPSRVPTMEEATAIADAVVAAYLGLDEDEWKAATDVLDRKPVKEIIEPIIFETYGKSPMSIALVEHLLDLFAKEPPDREREVMLACWDWFTGGTTAASVAAKIEEALDA